MHCAFARMGQSCPARPQSAPLLCVPRSGVVADAGRVARKRPYSFRFASFGGKLALPTNNRNKGEPMQKSVLMGVFLVALGGCAQLRVTYSSDPPGATLYQDGQPIGYMPYTLTYGSDVTEALKQGQCVGLRGTTAKWASGAEASVSSLTACPAYGLRQTYVFIRPDVPGREIDANFALQLQQGRVNAALMYQQNLIQQQRNAIMEKQRRDQLNRTVNCTSTATSPYTLSTRCQ